MTAQRNWPWWVTAEAPAEAELEPLLEQLRRAALAARIRRWHKPGKPRPATGSWSMTRALEEDIWPWMLAQPAPDAPHWKPVEERLRAVGDAAMDGFGNSTARHLTTNEVQDFAEFHFVLSQLAGASWCYAAALRALATTPYENVDRHVELIRELRTIVAEFQEFGEQGVAALERAETLLGSQLPLGPRSEPPGATDPDGS